MFFMFIDITYLIYHGDRVDSQSEHTPPPRAEVPRGRRRVKGDDRLSGASYSRSDICTECGQPLLAGEMRYKSERAHRACGRKAAKGIYHVEKTNPGLAVSLKAMKKRDLPHYRIIMADILSGEDGHIDESVKLALIKNVTKVMEKEKKLEAKDGLIYKNRKRYAAFMWSEERQKFAVSFAYFDAEDKKREKGLSNDSWSKHPRTKEWEIGVEKSRELDNVVSIGVKKQLDKKANQSIKASDWSKLGGFKAGFGVLEGAGDMTRGHVKQLVDSGVGNGSSADETNSQENLFTHAPFVSGLVRFLHWISE